MAGDDHHYSLTWLMPDTLAILVQLVTKNKGLSFHDSLQHLVELGLTKREEMMEVYFIR